ncbi:S41 family peptidase [Psychroserpens sp. AS72]|uniref:S41 family peptidase n=1 Tax=Psychroserpens sp. AS72 TaxID=3135775 RepID=UPI00317A68F4
MKNRINNLLIVLFVIVIFITFLNIFSCQKNSKINDGALDELTLINTVSVLLSENSPYYDINANRVKSKIDSIKKVIHRKGVIHEDELLAHIKHIISELGDRHASVKILDQKLAQEKYYLPFALAPWQKDQVIALKQLPKLKYSNYLEQYPFLMDIEGESIKDFIYRNDILNKYAPYQSRMSLGVEKMNEFYKIGKGYKVNDSVRLKFSNKDKTKDTLVYVNLVTDKTKWRERYKPLFLNEKNIESYNVLGESYANGIEYLKIPEMFDSNDDKMFFKWLEIYMNNIKNSNGLIIDIRNNSGGKRDLINFFSNYFIKPNEYHIANYARYKSKLTNDIEKSLNRRSLYKLNHFNENIQASILQKTPSELKDKSKYHNYSDLYYMVLENNQLFNNYYFYDKPVYILVNEKTFSAASVFASSFKGLGKIVLVGVNTDGSSGLSRSYEMNGLELKFSHMLSFQNSGKLFDGVGTEPDLEITRSEDQILGLEDHQLDVLLAKIFKNHN